MIVAALQFRPVFLDVRANLDTILKYVTHCDAQLAVLPELCTSGYFFHDSGQLESVAEACDGPTVQSLREVARSRHMIIVAGIAEKAPGGFFNSAVTILPDASTHVYRKIHLFGEEKLLFTPGDTGFQVVEYDGIRYGIMICYDWRFPEAARTMALKGAHVIAHPSDLVASPTLWRPMMVARSIENRVFTVTANRTGSETRGDDVLTFHGNSQIVAPNGDVLADADESFEGWIMADIDCSKAERKAFSPWNDIISDRRPEHYEL